MENDPILYLLVILAGLGGGAVAAGASLVGYTPNPDDPRPRPRCPFCPPLFGGVLAVIIWLLVGRGAGAEGVVATASIVGFVMGTAGGALSNIVLGASGRR